MVKKQQAKSAPAAEAAKSVKDSAQQIWQAGLAAFTRAQSEGNKAFESLVKEGMEIQRKTQSVAEGKIAKATIKVQGLASEISSKATDQIGKMEAMFEAGVAKALHKLGVPSDKDVKSILARMDTLTQAVQSLSKPSASPSASPVKRAAAKAAPSPVAVKKRAVKKAKTAAAPAQAS